MLHPWPEKPLDKVLELPGGFDRTLYVYDDSPLPQRHHRRNHHNSHFPSNAHRLEFNEWDDEKHAKGLLATT